MTTARDARLRTTFIFKFRTLTNNLNFLNQSNYLFGSFEITSIRLYTPLRNTLRELHGVYNLIEIMSSWTEQKSRSILNPLNAKATYVSSESRKSPDDNGTRRPLENDVYFQISYIDK
jgi:hypothetical protein